MVAVLEELPDLRMNVREESHYIGAIGAALFAHERMAGAHASALRQEVAQ
jgi:activator of 2-hydroxyglutaryl-CoA dehydratase